MSNEGMARVNLVDVMSVLHVGDNIHKNFSISDAGGGKFLTGGMFSLLELLRRVKFGGLDDLWIFCFDRQSFRKELALSMGINYKAGRNQGQDKSHLYVQSDELYYWLDKIGFNVMAVDGLEADDLIASYATMLKSYENIYVNIISSDRDLAVFVNERCSIVSPNSKVPNVTTANYFTTVGKKGHTVAYNTILLYKALCGDSSDKIPSACQEAYAVYKKVIATLTEQNIDLSRLNTEETVSAVLDLYLPEEVRRRAKENLALVKPHLLPIESLPLKPQEINFEIFKEFCSIFSMGNLARKFNIQMENFHESVYKYRLGLQKKLAQKSVSHDTIADSLVTEDSEELPTALERLAYIDSYTNLSVKTSINSYSDNKSTEAVEGETKASISVDIHVVD